MFKYYSSWIISLSFIWYLGYLCKQPFINYVDLYYCLQLICYGFVMFIVYLLYYKNYNFDKTLLLSLSIAHFLPLVLIYRIPRGKYTTETLVVTLFLYTMYLAYLGKDIYTVYLIDEHPETWSDIHDLCRLNKENNIPYCYIYKIFSSFKNILN